MKTLLIILFIIFNHATMALEVTTLTDEFNGSGGLTVDSDGNIYVSDFGAGINNANGTNVSKIDPDTGDLTLFATGFSGASGSVFGQNGLFYQSNIGNSTITRVESDGALTTIANSANGISSPVGLAFVSNGDLMVNNCGSNSISKIDGNGTVSLFISSNLLNCPNGLISDDNDNLYAVNFNDGNIIKVNPNGAASIFASTPGSSGKPSGGNGHIVFGNNQLYLVSNATHQVFSLSLDGVLTVVAGNGTQGRDDGEVSQASFSLPNGIGISPDGSKLYVNDSVPVSGFNTLSPNVVRVIQLTEDVAPPLQSIKANDGMSGTWYEPETSGQGILIDIKTDIDLFFAAWFTFDNEAPSSQRWLTVQSSLGSSNTIQSTIFNTTGGSFDSPVSVSSEDVGEFKITFTSCTTAEVEYSFNNQQLQGEISLTRLTPDIHCQELLPQSK